MSAKAIKWGPVEDQKILLYLLKNYGGKMPLEGLATELRCTESAVRQHIQKLKRSVAEGGGNSSGAADEDDDVPTTPKKRKRTKKADVDESAEGAPKAKGRAKGKKAKVEADIDEEDAE